MVKTKDNLLLEATKMRRHGKSYPEILKYLEHESSDEQIIGEIISVVENTVVISPERRDIRSIFSTLVSAALLSSGFVLSFLLWEQGYLAILPFILLGAGIIPMALSGNFKRLYLNNQI